MPRPVSDGTKAQILALYSQGKTLLEVSRLSGVSISFVTKYVREQLGRAGEVGRPRRPAPRTFEHSIPRETLARMPALYEELGSIEQVAKRLGVDAASVAKHLKRFGVELRPASRPREKAPEVYCRVCGALIPAKSCGYYGPEGGVVPARTCGKPECRAALSLGVVEEPAPVPRRELRNDKGGWTPQGKADAVRRQQLETKLLVERLPIDIEHLDRVLPVEQRGQYEALFELAEDRRGIARPANQSSVWGNLSRVPVYMRLISPSEGHAAIRLVLDAEETVFDRFMAKFFADQKQLILVSKAFRPLLAWRCACPKQTTWTLDTALDLPEKEGLYGLCPVCGACALNIWRED